MTTAWVTVTAVRLWHMKMFLQSLPLPLCSRLPPKHHPTTGLGSNLQPTNLWVGVTGVTEVNNEVKQAPSVGTPDRHYRPLERAREKRRLRLAESQKSDVLSAWERERVHLRCEQCNHVISDSDWALFKSEGWNVEIVKHCNTCFDSMARALAQSTCLHEFTDVE